MDFDFNPFDETELYFVLLDSRNRYALWPSFADIPAGSSIVYGEADLAACHAYLEVIESEVAL